jgi:hypothetical protein
VRLLFGPMSHLSARIWGVSDLESWTVESESSDRISPWRRGFGLFVLVLTVVLAVAFALGAWNPWQLVILQARFANPWLGVGIVGAIGYLAVWLLSPVQNEAKQGRSIKIRVLLAVVSVIGLIVGSILSLLYRYEATELDRSPDGERAVALVVSGGQEERDLRIWDVSGLFIREVESLGRPCHRLEASFRDRDTVVVNQGFGDWIFELDPETGRSETVLGPRCPDGPIPATLGR